MVGYCFFFFGFWFLFLFWVLSSAFGKTYNYKRFFFSTTTLFIAEEVPEFLSFPDLKNYNFLRGGGERERERERERIGWWGVIETVVLMAGIQSTNLYFFSFFFLLHFTNFLLLLNNLSTLTSLCFTLSTQLILLLQYTPLLFQFWFVFCFTLFNQ